MPYYGDIAAGDPGLFGFVRKIKLGRIVGGLVKSAFPGAAGVLSAVNAIRGGVKGSPLKETPPRAELTVAVPTMEPGKTVQVSSTRAKRAKAAGATFTTRGKAESPFARRMRLARQKASRARRGF